MLALAAGPIAMFCFQKIFHRVLAVYPRWYDLSVSRTYQVSSDPPKRYGLFAGSSTFANINAMSARTVFTLQ